MSSTIRQFTAAAVSFAFFASQSRADLPSGPVPATIQLDGLACSFDGTIKGATVTTNPSGLATQLSYGIASEWSGITWDAAGNLYVVNSSANSISKVLPDGTVTTFVNSGLSGPRCLTFDNSGDLFVGNAGNNSIVRVSPSGDVSPFVRSGSGLKSPRSIIFNPSGGFYVANAGNGTVSSVGSDGMVSSFVTSGLSAPCALALDGSRNLYIANSGNGTISKVSASGTINRFAKNLSSPSGLAFDSAGMLYVANSANGSIVRINPAGKVTPYVTNGLSVPSSLGVDNSGNLWVGDSGTGFAVNVSNQNSIQTMSLRPFGVGTYSVVGTISDPAYSGTATGALFIAPGIPAIITAPAASPITYGQRLGQSQLTGGMASAPGTFTMTSPTNRPNAGLASVPVTFSPTDTIDYLPTSLTVNVTVEPDHAQVVLGDLVVGYDGTVKSASVTTTPPGLGVNVSYQSELIPNSLTSDANGDIFMATRASGVISRISPSGVLHQFVTPGLGEPHGMATDASGNLYIAIPSSNLIARVTVDGNVSTFANKHLSSPWALTFDQQGTLYVANSGSDFIAKVASDGSVSRFASSGLSNPRAIAFNSTGSLYSVNQGNGTLTLTTPDGTTTTVVSGLKLSANPTVVVDGNDRPIVAGVLSEDGADDTSSTTMVRFDTSWNSTTLAWTGLSRPSALTFDSSGHLIVGNLGNATLGRYSLDGTVLPFTIQAVDAGAYDVTATVTDPNYTGTSKSTLVITPAPLTVTANNLTKVYGTAIDLSNGTAGYSVNGLAGTETVGSVTITAAGGTAAMDPVGDYALTPSLAIGGTFNPSNYSVTYIPGNLSVTPAPTTINIVSTHKFIYTGSGIGPVSANVTGSSGAVTWSYSSLDQTTYPSSSNLPVGVGEYQAIATVAADANYLGASSAPFNFVIVPDSAGIGGGLTPLTGGDGETSDVPLLPPWGIAAILVPMLAYGSRRLR
jgi:sugar lactone lactonase YvrE